MTWEKDEFTLYDERDVVDLDQLQALLGQTYWAKHRSREKIESVVLNSTCFSLFRGDELAGFVRVVSDFTVTSWISDMIILDAYQGRGLGRWMMQCVMSHPKLSGTQFSLQTADAHAFYEKLGFARRDMLMSTQLNYTPDRSQQ